MKTCILLDIQGVHSIQSLVKGKMARARRVGGL